MLASARSLVAVAPTHASVQRFAPVFTTFYRASPLKIRDAFFCGLALTSLYALTGCGLSAEYRNSAVVPAARPINWDGRTAGGGAIRAEGSLSYEGGGASPTDVRSAQGVLDFAEYALPEMHATAVHVPQTTLDGYVGFGVADSVEIGMRGSYASYSWTRQSKVGTMPIPSKSAVWGLGPELRLGWKFGNHFALGVAGNLLYTKMPVSSWQRDEGCFNAMLETRDGVPESGLPSSVEYDGSGCHSGYTLISESTESAATFSLGVYPSLSFDAADKWGHVFLSASIARTFQNDGFSDTPVQGALVQGDGVVPFFGLGYGVALGPVDVTAQGYVPLSAASALDYGTGFALSLGGVFGGDDDAS